MKIEMENTTLPSKMNTAGAKSRWASFEFYPEKEGRAVYMFRGVSYEDTSYATRRDVLVKVFKNKAGSEKDWFDYCNRARNARTIAKSFNKLLSKHSSDMAVQFVNPHVAAMEKVFTFTPVVKFFKPYDKTIAKDEHVVFESLLDGDFQTFVNKEGAMDMALGSVLQSLSHYSYYKSEGALVLTGLKGVLEGNDFILTVPNIHSKAKEFGMDDKGLSGINEFFRHHSCTAICNTLPKMGDYFPFQSANPSAPFIGYVLPPLYSHPRDTSDYPLPPPYAEKCSYEASCCDRENQLIDGPKEEKSHKDLPMVHNSCQN